jgi:hydrogenase maturation protease
MPRLLVLGIGNILLLDEGAGVYAVQELQKEAWPDTVEFMDGGTFTQDIFYLFKDYAGLLVLDCVRAGHPAGTVYRLGEDDLVKNESQSLSVHDIDLLDSLRMAELLGNRPAMRVVGMEPERIDWHMGLTPVVEASMPTFLEAAREEIRAYLRKWADQEEGGRA